MIAADLDSQRTGNELLDVAPLLLTSDGLFSQSLSQYLGVAARCGYSLARYTLPESGSSSAFLSDIHCTHHIESLDSNCSQQIAMRRGNLVPRAYERELSSGLLITRWLQSLCRQRYRDQSCS
jgi:hypothetical protein